MANLFVFAGTNWETLVPESDTKIIYIVWVLYFDFFNHFVSLPIGIASVNITRIQPKTTGMLRLGRTM